MKQMLLVLFTTLSLPAFVPPPQPPKGRAFPTFGQMVQHEEKKQELRRPALENLPGDLKREIFRITFETGPILNIPAMARNILNLAATNKAFRTAVNDPKNMLLILQSLPTKAAAMYLADKLGKMPGIQSKEVQEWLKNIKLVDGQKLYIAVDAEDRDPKIVADILKNPNIELNWKDSDGNTALIKANSKFIISSSNIPLDRITEIIRLLLAAGANVNEKNDYGSTALIRASSNRSLINVKLLITAGANVNAQNNNGETALILASKYGNTEVVRELLDAGANINKQDERGTTSLMHATFADNSIEIIRLLLAAGAQLNMKSNSGGTALMQACRCGHPEIVRLFLAAGANPTLRSKEGATALGFAYAGDCLSTATPEDRKEIIQLLESALHGREQKSGPAKPLLSPELLADYDILGLATTKVAGKEEIQKAYQRKALQ